MPPIFYFAIGARAQPSDLAIALAVGQRHFLAPAGSPAARMLARTAGVHVALDSWAFPPGNTDRPSLPRYAHMLAGWHARSLAGAAQPESPWLDWALSYDTIGDPHASERDGARLDVLCQQLCRTPDPPIVPVTHYPGPGAAAIIGELLRDRAACLDDEEHAQAHQRAAWGFHDGADGPADRPACAIGGLVPARYSRDSARWYEQLIAELEAAAALDPFQRRIHLLGVGKPSWVLASPLVMSFDSSGPARLAQVGFAHAIGRRYTSDYAISAAALQRSRAARLAYHLIRYRAQVGLPWQPVDEALLPDDRIAPARPQPAEAGWGQAELPLTPAADYR